MGIDASKLSPEYQRQINEQTNKTLAARSQTPIPQSPIRDEPLGAVKVQKRDSRLPHVRISQFTRRLQDSDNCCPKYEIDWLRYKGFITDDNHDSITLSVRQIKVATEEEEGVLIEIL